MPINKYLSIFLFILTAPLCFAQTADEVIGKYLEQTGGIEKWQKLSATKMIAEAENEGMIIPLTIYNTAEGKQAIVVNLEDREITQFAYDGKTLWSTNSNMQPQKADEESTQNMKFSKNDFPNPFVDYKKKNYKVSYLGKENVNGSLAHKILLIQEPIKIEGVEEESASYHYFHAETFLPVMVETEIKGGPLDGQFSTSKFKDYKKVEGLYFPFSIIENGRELKIQKIELNPNIEDQVFAFPKE